MKSSGLICGLIFTVVSGAAVIHAQETGGVTVSHVQTQIKVTVNGPTPLNRVLDEFCRQTNAQCQGTQEAKNVAVFAQEFVGDWREVVTTLLDGADLNYVVSMPPGLLVGTLEILGVASGPQQSARAGGMGPDAPYNPKLSSDEPELSTRVNAGAESDAETGGQPNTTVVDPAPLSAGTQSLPRSASETPAEAGRLNLSTDNLAGSGKPSLPFPDTFVNPIAASNYTPEYLPFPGKGGNPIPVSNSAAPSFFPFPGSDGKPIAVSNQPVQYLPFPDSSGRPIPVQPVSAH